jgi:hypothetical protein
LTADELWGKIQMQFAKMFILEKIIESVREVNMTPILALYSALGFILFLAVYHWSGLAEKIENLTGAKKIIVLFFVALIIFVFYYVFYKAGKFDRVISSSTFEIITEKISNIVDR